LGSVLKADHAAAPGRGLSIDRAFGGHKWLPLETHTLRVRGVAAVLDALYPRGDRYIIVKVTSASRPAGWAVCVDTRMKGNAYFGDMRVGTIVDCLARPGHADVVAGAALTARL